ncbi:hypothetical protein Tco_0693343 [Tanacetum coccineum]
MACDNSCKSKLAKLSDENVLLKTQVESVVQERENIKLKYQTLFNSIRATWVQHQREVNELIENVNQKTYAYGYVRVESSNNVKRPKSKDTKSKNKVLKNTKVKSPSTNIWMVSSSVSIGSNKRETMNSIVYQSNANVLKEKTINVVNDGLNIACVSCGKDVFMLSHKKCVARYALSVDSRVKRALFTCPIAEKSRNLGATSVVVKSRFSVAKIPTATNKVSSASSLSPDSSQSRKLSNYMKTKIARSRKWQKWFEYQQHFNWSPKSKMHSQHLRNSWEQFAKATSTKSWLCHRRLSNLNFATINHLKKQDLVDGLLKFKYDKYHLCSAYSLEDSQSVPSKEDLDNLFGPLYEEYYVTRTPKVSNDSATNTLDNEDTPSSSLIVVEEDEAPQIVSSLEEPVANEPANPVSNENANEPVQEDVTTLDRNYFYNPFHTPVFE